jgi:hypothetical protein
MEELDYMQGMRDPALDSDAFSASVRAWTKFVAIQGGNCQFCQCDFPVAFH